MHTALFQEGQQHLTLVYYAGPEAQQVRASVALMRWLHLYILAEPTATQADVPADLASVFSGALTLPVKMPGEGVIICLGHSAHDLLLLLVSRQPLGL